MKKIFKAVQAATHGQEQDFAVQYAARKNVRYRVIADNDGHDYIIPADGKSICYRWVTAEGEGEEPPKLDFEPIRINSTKWTFTDPQGYWDFLVLDKFWV